MYNKDNAKGKIIRYVITILLIVCIFFGLIYVFSPSSFKRKVKDVESNWTGGLNRHLTVYTADGNILAQYDGKIDLEQNESGVVKFDYKGKRYMYYNCFVEVIEK